MNMQKWCLAVLLSFCFLLNLSVVVNAEGEVNLSEFPEQLAEKLTINIFPAQLLATALMFIFFETPVLLASRKGFAAHLLVGIIVLGFCVGIGWLHYSFLLIMLLLIALMFSSRMRGLITGGD